MKQIVFLLGFIHALWLVGFQTSVEAQAIDPLPERGTILTANRLGGSISFYDIELKAEMARLPLRASPHEIVVSPDGRLALTSEYGANNNPGQRLIVIDIAAAKIAGTIDLGPKSRPHYMAFLPDNVRAVATMQDNDQIALVDTKAMRILKIYPTHAKGSHMLRLSPDGKRAYVANRGGDGSVTVVFLDGSRDPVVIPAGKGTEGIAISPDGSKLWVAGRRDKTLTIIDTDKLEVLETLNEAYSAGRIEIMPDGRVVVPEGRPNHTFHIYDGQTHRETSAQKLYHDGTDAGGQYGLVAVGGGLLVTDVQRGQIIAFDQFGTTQSKTLFSGREAPDGIAFSPLRINAVANRK